MYRFLFRGTLTRFLFNFSRFLFRTYKLNIMSQRSNKSLILVRNIINKHKNYISNKYQTFIWPLTPYSEEESIHFEEICFRVVGFFPFGFSQLKLHGPIFQNLVLFDLVSLNIAVAYTITICIKLHLIMNCLKKTCEIAIAHVEL